MANSERSHTGPDISVERVHGEGAWARISSVGTTGERAFVLVSGLGVSSHYFEQLAPHLMQFGPVYALDLPGFGGVPHAPRALSIREFADLVGKAIDKLGLDDPIVVGHSMGAQISTELAAARSGLSDLILISPVVDDEARFLHIQALRFLRASWHEPFRVKLLAIVAYLTCGFGWFVKILPRMMSYRIERTAERVEASTLIIRGEFDAVCPRSWVTRLSRAFARASVVEIKGAAHSVMHAHAQEVAALCVREASKWPVGDGDGIAVMPELPEKDSSLGPVDALRVTASEVKGMALELKGSRQDDDRLVERGRDLGAAAHRRARE